MIIEDVAETIQEIEDGATAEIAMIEDVEEILIPEQEIIQGIVILDRF